MRLVVLFLKAGKQNFLESSSDGTAFFSLRAQHSSPSPTNMSSSSSSHHPSPLLFLVHLSLLPLPHPPSSLTLPLCLTQTSPTSSRTHLRDLLLSSLFDLLPSSSSQQPPPKPSHAPSSAQHTAFVNAATTFLMDLRKKGLEGEEGGGGWWWKEVKGSVRKSDFADAFGSR